MKNTLITSEKVEVKKSKKSYKNLGKKNKDLFRIVYIIGQNRWFGFSINILPSFCADYTITQDKKYLEYDMEIEKVENSVGLEETNKKIEKTQPIIPPATPFRNTTRKPKNNDEGEYELIDDLKEDEIKSSLISYHNTP